MLTSLSATLGPRKATLSPQDFAFTASIPCDTAKTLLRCKASSPGVHGAASLGGGRSTTSLIVPPSAPSPLLSLPLPKARPCSLPERGGPERLDFLPDITRTR